MLRFNGKEVFWNGTPVGDLKYHELSCAERFELLCAVSPHDPVQFETTASDDSTVPTAQDRS